MSNLFPKVRFSNKKCFRFCDKLHALQGNYDSKKKTIFIWEYNKFSKIKLIFVLAHEFLHSISHFLFGFNFLLELLSTLIIEDSGVFFQPRFLILVYRSFLVWRKVVSVFRGSEG